MSQPEKTDGFYPTVGVNNRFGYRGYWYEPEIGKYLCRNRVYDPRFGRWLTRDPIGYAGGWNLYRYCGGRPVDARDPIGLDPDDGDPWPPAWYSHVIDWLLSHAPGNSCAQSVTAIPEEIGDPNLFARLLFGSGTIRSGLTDGPHGSDAGHQATVTLTGAVGAVHDGAVVTGNTAVRTLTFGLIGFSDAELAKGLFDASNPYLRSARIGGFIAGVIGGGLAQAGLWAAANAGSQVAWYTAASTSTVQVGVGMGQVGYGIGLAIQGQPGVGRSILGGTLLAGGGFVGAWMLPVGPQATTTAYSVAYEMTLTSADIGTSRTVHASRAVEALENMLSTDTQFASTMETLIPGLRNALRSGRVPDYRWHHDATRIGVMQLVPASQHAPRSVFSHLLHPDGLGGYSRWAIPAGAQPNGGR